MNVLSIDFDYFQKTTEKLVRSVYPEGVDNNTEMSEIAWGNVYASFEEKMSKVEVNERELALLKEVLTKQDSSCPVMIANSHVNIFDFIYDNGDCTDIDLVNIDMHDDYNNGNEELDCGNWVSFLESAEDAERRNLSLTWIANPLSFNIMKCDELKNAAKKSIDCISGKSFDVIFLCRSDTWTPPHLDCYFTELCDVIKEHFTNILIEKGIDEPRVEYKEIAKQLKEVLAQMKKTAKKKSEYER